MRKSQIKDYPVGLLEAAMINEKSEEPIDYYNLTEDQMQGLETMMQRLSDREQDVILLRYKEKMSLRTIGERYGISYARVRQITNRAAVKLSSPDCLGYIVRGYHAQIEYIEKINILQKTQNEKNPKEMLYDMESVKLQDLEFSTQTHNRLVVCGVTNLAELVDLVSHDNWYKKIRLMGTKRADEVMWKLKEIGAINPDE